ncbi:hypothetical protein HHI36_000073 [Cryptolaemus montrouzieri]|uniref:SCAN domain-containing protein n=1 Tax=Cryptolaemus montrouzieri TaxID=559131 RepID=A0ABD2P3W4_9CUCU
MQTAEDSDNTTQIQMTHGNETLNNPTNIEVPLILMTSQIEELGNIKVMRIENIESSSSDCHVCSVCGKETSQAHFCSCCLKPVHSICGISCGEEGYGSEVLCFLCKNEQANVNERQQAHKRVKRAAEKMIDNTAKKIALLEIGNCVLLNVPKIDRGPLDTKNIIGEVVDVKKGVYKIGTSSGTMKIGSPDRIYNYHLKITANLYQNHLYHCDKL